MSFPPHITDEQIRQYAAQTLSPADWEVLERHLQECASCRQQLAVGSDFAGMYEHLESQFPIDASVHPEFQRLAEYAEEKGDSEEREIIRQHLAVCALCEAEVHDLRQMTEALVPEQVTISPPKIAFRTRKVLPFAMAASIAILAIVIASRVMHPNPVSPEVARDINHQKIEFTNPAVRELVAAGDTVSSPLGSLTMVNPVNIAVREPIPIFSWTDAIPTNKYCISVLAQGRVICSETLAHVTQWQPKVALPQGTVLRWRLETLGANSQTSESSFLILTRADNAKISDAEKRDTKYPLILGTIYAEAGLFEDAKQALAQEVKSNPSSPAAQKLLDQVQALHPSVQ